MGGLEPNWTCWMAGICHFAVGEGPKTRQSAFFIEVDYVSLLNLSTRVMQQYR